MTTYILRRLAYMIPVLFLVSLMVLLLLQAVLGLTATAQVPIE